MTDGSEPAGGGLFSRDLEPPPRASWSRRAVILGAITLIMGGMWVWVNSSADGAIRAMSPAQREAFYQEAWADHRAKCLGSEGPKDTQAQCRQRAEYLLHFPQCDAACRAELAPSLPGPTP